MPESCLTPKPTHPFVSGCFGACRMLTLAAQLRHVRGFFAVLAAVFAMRAVLRDDAFAGGMCAFVGVSHVSFSFRVRWAHSCRVASVWCAKSQRTRDVRTRLTS